MLEDSFIEDDIPELLRTDRRNIIICSAFLLLVAILLFLMWFWLFGVHWSLILPCVYLASSILGLIGACLDEMLFLIIYQIILLLIGIVNVGVIFIFAYINTRLAMWGFFDCNVDEDYECLFWRDFLVVSGISVLISSALLALVIVSVKYVTRFKENKIAY